MDFLYLLQSARTAVGDLFFSLITHLGEETLFIVVAMFFFWCIDKKRGYFLLLSGFLGVVTTQFFKMIFRIPRPWILDPEFPIVESARAEATGYSFPSGHTQSSATLYGGIARTEKRRWIRVTCLVLILLIAFSRMYLGVHTPKDVLVSLLIAAVLVFGVYPLYSYASEHPKWMYVIISAVSVYTVMNLIFVQCFPFPSDVDPVIYMDALSVAWKLTGISLAMCVIYPVDQLLLKFETRAVWWVQILKLVGGTVILLGVRVIFKSPLQALFGASVGDCLRYFLMGIAGGVLWPLSFRYFAKLETKKT